MNAATKPEKTPLDIITDRMYSHVHVAPERWHGRLHFNEWGASRLVATYGWIAGVATTNPDFAERLADDLFARLDFLANYAGTCERDGVTLPRCRVVLGDDGTLGGFTVAWHRLVAPEEAVETRADLTVERCVHDGGHTRLVQGKYRFSVNGAMLYRGPGAGETFSVSTSRDCLWDINS